MTNLLSVLPDFDIKPYTHILPSLEKTLISTSDLLTLDAIDVAKRAQVPASEVRKLCDALLDGLKVSPIQGDNASDDASETRGASPFTRGNELKRQWTISTLDAAVDETLSGGIHSGYLTEITGESAAGKTQFLLSLLLSVQLPRDGRDQKAALYISTEAQLQTTRLNQILESHPKLAGLNSYQKPSLGRVQSTHIHDLEAQEHILRYQVPVIVERFNVGLVVIDSIAANYRAEFEKGKTSKTSQSLAKRSTQIAQLGYLLRKLAHDHQIAVVVANQVADRFEPQAQIAPMSQSTQRSRPGSPPPASASLASGNGPPDVAANDEQSSTGLLSTEDPLALDHQQRFFTGWGDNTAIANLKTPSLGLTWTNQLSTRIALLRDPIYEDKAYRPGEDKVIAGWRRTMKVVFSAWCPSGETAYEIWQGGVRAVAGEPPAAGEGT